MSCDIYAIYIQHFMITIIVVLILLPILYGMGSLNREGRLIKVHNGKYATTTSTNETNNNNIIISIHI